MTPGEARVTATRIADALERLRSVDARVHCITNSVAQTYTANMLLALGATPSMTVDAGEVAAFVESADALLVNLGTMDAGRRHAVDAALKAADLAGVPWVLDPVLINRTPARRDTALKLLRHRPKIMRANASELSALNQRDESLTGFAARHAITVALTGATDRISDGTRSVALENGHALMARVTAMGCAMTAVVTALLAVERDPFEAAIAGVSIVNIAGEIAVETAAGPGSFAIAILDVLHALKPIDIERRLRIDDGAGEVSANSRES